MYVCLSVTYTGPKSRTERPRKTKIGIEVAHVTCDLDTAFRVKRSTCRGGAYCGGLLHSLLVDLSHSAHLSSGLNQRRARSYFLESVSLGSKDSGVCWAGSLPKQQLELLLLQRSLSQEPLQVVFQEMEPTSVLQPTPLQEPVADLGFFNGPSS